MTTITLRVKTKNGQHVLNQLESASTVDELKQKLSSLTSIPSQALKVLQGFPPKPIDITNGDLSLLDLNFRSGDTLIVEENPAAKVAKLASVNDQLFNDYMSQMQNGAQGVLVRKVVPANNSCLFTSVHFVMENGDYNLEAAGPMRELIAGVVMSDPVTYDAAFLEKDNADYCTWIMNDQSWGGAIEVSILSKYYGIEIAVVDTQNCRISRFGEDQKYRERVLLIYDGIHYDPLMLEPLDDSSQVITKFSTDDETILNQALELAAEAKASRQFTDVHKFSLRCLVCQKALVGQTEAQQHAKETGHINFGEY